MAAVSRRGFPRLVGMGPALAVTELAAVLLAGLLVGARPVIAVTAAATAVLVARAADLQRPRLVLSIVEDLPGLCVTAAVAALAVTALGTAGLVSTLVFAAASLAGLVLGHAAVFAAARVLRRTGRLRRRVLVVGTGPTARHLAPTLLARPELGLEPRGFVGAGPEMSLTQARGLPLTLLDPVSRLPRAMTEARVHTVVLALSGPASDAELAALDGLLASSAEVHAVPIWLPAARAHARHPAELVGGVPLARLHRRGARAPVRAFKRVVGVVVALAALAVLLPPALVLALLTWLETGGVLVRRERVDVTGRARVVARFRTRRARSVGRPGTTFSVAISGRLGPVGRLLRRTRLDGLPQVILTLVDRVRYAGGVALVSGAAPPADPHEAKVETGQLTR